MSLRHSVQHKGNCSGAGGHKAPLELKRNLQTHLKGLHSKCEYHPLTCAHVSACTHTHTHTHTQSHMCVCEHLHVHTHTHTHTHTRDFFDIRNAPCQAGVGLKEIEVRDYLLRRGSNFQFTQQPTGAVGPSLCDTNFSVKVAWTSTEPGPCETLGGGWETSRQPFAAPSHPPPPGANSTEKSPPSTPKWNRIKVNVKPGLPRCLRPWSLNSV